MPHEHHQHHTRGGRRRALGAGALAVTPMLPGVVPFGMATGVAAVEAGLGASVALGMSLLIFAGAAQLAVTQLLADGAVLVVILFTGLIINLRMLMYSASLAPHLGHLPLRWTAPLAYLLTDQAYALAIERFRAGLYAGTEHWYYLGLGLPVWLVWLPATALGVWLGTAIPPGWQIGFSVPLIFLALLMPALRDTPSVAAAVVGGGVALLAHDAPFHSGLTLGAVAGIAAGAIVERAGRRGEAP